MLPRIPEREIAVARHLGLRETDIQSSWTRYAKWAIEKFGEARAELGGESWLKWAREDAINLAKNREGVDEAKDRARREAEAYKREAVTFDGWVAALGRRKARGIHIEGHEARVLAWYERQPEPKPRGSLAMLRFMADSIPGRDPVDRAIAAADVPLTPEVIEERRAQAMRDLQNSELLEGLGLVARAGT